MGCLVGFYEIEKGKRVVWYRLVEEKRVILVVIWWRGRDRECDYWIIRWGVSMREKKVDYTL